MGKPAFAQRQEVHDDRGESHFDGKPLPGLAVEDLGEMSSRGLRAPVYRQSSGAVHVTLSALRSIDDDVLAALPRGAESLLGVLRTAGRPLSTGGIIDAVGSSRPTVTKQLQALRRRRGGCPRRRVSAEAGSVAVDPHSWAGRPRPTEEPP